MVKKSCENCCYCIHSLKLHTEVCLNCLDPTPVSLDNVCEGHRFKIEFHKDDEEIWQPI